MFREKIQYFLCLNIFVFYKIKMTKICSKIRQFFSFWQQKKIGFKLKELGISPELIEENINNLDGNEDEINLVSAITLVKKRSIGPYRKVEFTDKVKNREFGILSRAGFSYAISKKVLINMDKNEIENHELWKIKL